MLNLPSWLAEAAGGMKGRALYNAKSVDYKSLIEAWSIFSGAQLTPKLPPKTGIPTAKPRHRIARNYVEPISNTRNVSKNDEIVSNLELQISLLKAEKASMEAKLLKKIGIESLPIPRPRGRTLLINWKLNKLDIEALKQVANPEFLRAQGWKLDPKFQVINSSGEVVFHSGFIQGIRKILAVELGAREPEKENADE